MLATTVNHAAAEQQQKPIRWSPTGGIFPPLPPLLFPLFILGNLLYILLALRLLLCFISTACACASLSLSLSLYVCVSVVSAVGGK